MRVPTNRWFTLPLLIAAAAIVILGTFSYSMLTRQTSVDGETLRFMAERILFFALCELALLLAVWSMVVYRGVRIEKRLDRLIEQSRYRKLRKDKDFRKLGQLGPRLESLYAGLTETNEKLGTKIAGQAELLDLIISSATFPLLVTTSAGTVCYASKTLLSILEKEKHQLTGRNVSDIWDNIEVQSLKRRFETDFQPAEIEGKDYPITVYPVLGESNLVVYMVFNTEKRPLFYNAGSRETKKSASHFSKELSRFFSRRKNRQTGPAKKEEQNR